MHVLILQPYLAPYRVGLFRALQRQPGVRLTLLYFGRPERRRHWGGVTDPELRALQLRSLVVPAGYERNWSLTNVPHLAALLRRERPDVVVCAPQAEGQWLRLLQRVLGYRLMVWTEQTLVSTRGRTPSSLMRRWFFPGVDACLVPGRESRACLRQLYGVPDTRIHEAPNSCDERPYSASAAEVAERWSDPAAPLRVAFVGSLHPRKGADLLVPALADVRRQAPQLAWELHVAGTGPIDLPAAPGLIQHGHLDASSCARLLRGCHLFVLPSRHDCNPLSALEAAKAGLVPLLSDGCGNHPELASHGWVFARNSGPALVEALLAALRTPRAHLGQRAEATRRIGAEITHERTAARFHAVLEQVMSRPIP